ncbi:MAG: NADH-quinone oxidoreductase subunit NuoF [Candidatus Schekmanbacteria bacterium]|nr:NADH-quinone oxidoreductase subunit NuoF [Candidatus Schekmanbacteria bacterium]
MEKIILKNADFEDQPNIDAYISRGGYKALEKALTMEPAAITDEVKKAGIRGRGGAGFPAGLKWSFIPKDTKKPIYLVCNADEGEPGTFKDRFIIERDPHLLVEGIAVSSYALKVKTAYIYIRGEFYKGAMMLEKAIEEAKAKGFLGSNVLGRDGVDIDIVVHRGAGAYVCGEETSLLESLEGKRGYPRLKPPFPAVVGAFGCPTVINNVETLAAVPWIILNGGAAYAKIGTEKSTGTKLFSVCGKVNKPGVYEVDLGYPFKKFLDEYCGGVKDGKKLKAVIPGGSSTPVLPAEEIEKVNLDYESIAAAGSMLGSGAVIVFDETDCMVEAITVLAHFYAHESCGQCTPCREGTAWMYRILQKIMNGEGKLSDIDLLYEICDNIMGKTVCPLGDAAAMPVVGFLNKYRHEFEYHIKNGKCDVKEKH